MRSTMNRTRIPPWLGPLLLVVVGVLAPVVASRGGTAFTTDTARAYEVRARPRLVPTVALLDADSAARMLSGDGRAHIVDFIATRCHTLCAAQNGIYQMLQRDIGDRALAARVGLVTISFDPAWDTPRALRDFSLAQGVDRARWTVLTPRDSSALRPLLRAFGITVISDGNEFIHNTALHVVSPNGRLVAIYPIAAADEALAYAASLTDSVP
jgi:protein SCO1